MDQPVLPDFTLGDLLRQRANAHPDRIAFSFRTFQDPDEPRVEELSFSTLFDRSRRVAEMLARELSPGDRALILCQPGLAYVIAFLGCQLAGVIAVPAYPPRNQKHMGRLEAILSDAQVSTVLCRRDQLERLKNWFSLGAELSFHAVDDLSDDITAEWHSPPINKEAISFLQYTSGTTGDAKGVMVTHQQVFSNIDAIHTFYGFSGVHTVGPEHALGCWLPPYHDMGLVGTIIYPLYAGMTSHMMGPVSFIQRPKRWLRMLSETRATITIAPNFAWQLCVDEIDHVEDLDLSSLIHALNGAETIRLATLEAFCRKFESAGFNRNCFRPVYGMAETVVLTSGLAADRGSARPRWEECVQDQSRLANNLGSSGNETEISVEPGRKSVSCGEVIDGHDLIVVDPETFEERGEGEVGEIWVSGPSVASGYWNKPDLTEEIFRARKKNDRSGHYYLRTGDLGTIVGGQIYILGRRKEMIIVRGTNYYATDLETTANQSDPLLGHDRTIAIAAERDDEEQLVLIHELSRYSMRRFHPTELARSISRSILDVHEINVACVVFVRPASCPRTTSGKLQRLRARAMFRDGSLSEVARWEASLDTCLLGDTGLVRRLGGFDGKAQVPTASDIEASLLELHGVREANAAWYLDSQGRSALQVVVTKNHIAPIQGGATSEGDGRMRFGLFFFGSDDPVARFETRYELLLKASELADQAGLEAVWTPERHFGEFGGHIPGGGVAGR